MLLRGCARTSASGSPHGSGPPWVPPKGVEQISSQRTSDHRQRTTDNPPTPRTQAPEITCRYCAPAIDRPLPARRCRCAADQWMVACSPLWPAYQPVHPRGVPLRMCAIPVASCGTPLRIACAPDDGCGAAFRPCGPRAARRLRRVARATSPIEAVRRGIAACGAEVKPGAPPLPASPAPRSSCAGTRVPNVVRRAGSAGPGYRPMTLRDNRYKGPLSGHEPFVNGCSRRSGMQVRRSFQGIPSLIRAQRGFAKE